MKKGLILLLALALAPLGIFDKSHACGMLTHTEISMRAGVYFDNEAYPDYAGLILADIPSLQAGANFPDWGYFSGYGEEAEEAHWLPFIKHSIEYIRRNYPQPWDREAQRMVVFMMGVLSHHWADLTFHSLEGVKDGFISAMAGTDFYGSFGDAHDAADFGGDIVISRDYDTSWVSCSWYVPIYDLAEIYNELGYDRVTPEILAQTNLLLFVGLQAERILGPAAYPYFSSKSPFLVELMQDYFVGGIDEMSVRSAWGIEDMIGWLENGTAPDILTLFNIRPGNKEENLNEILDMANTLLKDNDYQITQERTKRGVTFRIMTLKRSEAEEASSEDFLEGDKDFSYFGSSLASGDFDGDGIDDIAVGVPGFRDRGSPQAGAVYVYRGKIGISNINAGDIMVQLKGGEAFSRFGYAMAVFNINADGYDDLAVSAPLEGSADFSYKGAVYVYFGGGSGLSESPDTIIKGNDTHTNLGTFLLGADIDRDGHKDLVIGSPFAPAGGNQRGMVSVFYSSWNGGSVVMDISEAGETIYGDEDYAWFGWHAACSEKLLLVSAPAADYEANLSSGKVFGYELNKMNEPAFILSGMEKFSKFGHSFSIGRPYDDGKEYLAVAEPSRNMPFMTSAGQVTLFELDELNGIRTTDEITPRSRFIGSQSVGRLGWNVAFRDINADGYDELIMGSPWTNGGSGPNSGQVLIWNGGQDFPNGILPQFPLGADRKIAKAPKKSRFGETFIFGDFNGDARTDMAFSSPIRSLNKKYAGAVYFEFTDGPFMDVNNMEEGSKGESGNTPSYKPMSNANESQGSGSSICFIMASAI